MEEELNSLITEGFLSTELEPLKCPHCNSNELVEVVKDTINGIPCEIEKSCDLCKKVVGYWGYGSWEP